MYLTWFVVIGTALIGVGRFTVPSRPLSKFSWSMSYEALAHVWCGVLIGLAMTSEDWRLPMVSFAGLVVFEVVMFLAQKGGWRGTR